MCVLGSILKMVLNSSVMMVNENVDDSICVISNVMFEVELVYNVF